ncbi:hypothetical protein [Stutzerimonas nitrititolerans]|uniref:hypothetical protein n=1 Tax=Stutzerimonas nitrititolerans TaxID=2482751 RepID=UPI00289F1F25|nr:hypothetical protein [Stutzerimonas nitrititolerans]
MGNIIDMASFEHLRRSNTDDRYTCPKTNVTFPHIYKVMIPDGELINDQATFWGTFSAYYQLKEEPRHGNSTLPGFPPSTATEIATLQAEDGFYLDIIHFSRKERWEGFRDACFHLGMDMEAVSWTANEHGFFILLVKEDDAKKSSHVIYHSSGVEYVNELGQMLECRCVAAFNSFGVIVPYASIETYMD